MEEIEICFSEEDFNKILKYMEDTGAETVRPILPELWSKNERGRRYSNGIL